MADCIFCDILEGRLPCARVWEDHLCIVFMDLYPWRPGHTLIIPKQHAQHLNQLDNETRNHLFEMVSRVRAAIPQSPLSCDGANIFINDGKAANQHVPHLHVHVLPRTRGDSWKVAGILLARMRSVFGAGESMQKLQAQANSIRAVMERPEARDV